MSSRIIIAKLLIKLAALPMKVTSVSRRGVEIGIGPLVEIPPMHSGAQPGQGYAKKLFWDPEENKWSYSYLSKGRPKRGETIGVGDRAVTMYYSVTRSTPTLVELKYDRRVKVPANIDTERFPPILKLDTQEKIDSLQKPTWFRTVAVKPELVQKSFPAVVELAQKTWKKFSHESPAEDRPQSSTIEQYTQTNSSRNNLLGRMQAYEGLVQFLDSVDGDARTIARVKQHLTGLAERGKESLSKLETQMNSMKKELEESQKRQQKHSASFSSLFRKASLGLI